MKRRRRILIRRIPGGILQRSGLLVQEDKGKTRTGGDILIRRVPGGLLQRSGLLVQKDKGKARTGGGGYFEKKNPWGVIAEEWIAGTERQR